MGVGGGSIFLNIFSSKNDFFFPCKSIFHQFLFDKHKKIDKATVLIGSSRSLDFNKILKFAFIFKNFT